jgi:hypothetical protein
MGWRVEGAMSAWHCCVQDLPDPNDYIHVLNVGWPSDLSALVFTVLVTVNSIFLRVHLFAS